jgi:hypothetical protein
VRRYETLFLPECVVSSGFGDEKIVSNNNEIINNPAMPAPMIILNPSLPAAVSRSVTAREVPLWQATFL